MSLIKKQEPNNLHSVFIPSHYTYQTDVIDDKFKFKYYLSDINSEFFAGLTVPLENNLSYNTPNEVLQHKTLFNFQPTIKKIVNIPSNCVVYNQKIVEGIDSGDETNFKTKTAFRYSNPEFNPYDNFIGNSADSDFLVNMPVYHKLRAKDNFTFRTYNGYPNVDTTEIGGVYVYKLELNTIDGQISGIKLESHPNQFYATQPSDVYSATTSGDDYMIELPAGLPNFHNVSFTLRGFYDENGTWVDTSYELIVLHSAEGTNKFSFTYNTVLYEFNITSYDYYAYRWPHGNNGRVSKIHHFEIIDDCQYDSINVAWENSKGGIDYYLFTKSNEKSIKVDKNEYKQSMYDLDINIGNVKKDKYNRGLTVSNTEKKTQYEIKTDWLSQSEIDGFEDLFSSTEVYAFINDKWVYVINADNKAVIYNKKKKGLKKYVINLIISETEQR